MSNTVGPVNSIAPLTPLDNKELTGSKTADQGSTDFSGFFKDALAKLDSTQAEAEQATIDMITGQTDNFHTPVIAVEKANLALGLAVTVRNKVLDAYHEIMRMQI
ncbi:MAG: Flagellar hook-basal body complex protein FliE [Candidatus Dichloromethanomonas elyunquensis]|nr:MAG: Flagellar hook-basal body complex protein FliE [Candidatus Dichloromethanomonas elyunquensis]